MTKNKGNIYICITIDWEGEDLNYIEDLNELRAEFDEVIPFTHFICPNYFIEDNAIENSHIIKKNIANIDEIALHIHCYKELINEVGIPFRTNHNYHNTLNWFEKKILKRIIPSYNRVITGRGVPLSVYSDLEIESILSFSKNLLAKYLDLETISGFRAGGWIANDTVLNIIEKLNFRYDSSAVPPSILSNGYSKNSNGNLRDNYGDKNGAFTKQIIKLWGHQIQEEAYLQNTESLNSRNFEEIKTTTQPYTYKNIKEIPNNCALSDFSSFETSIKPLIKDYLNKLEQGTEENYFIIYGCHQEGEKIFKTGLFELARYSKSIDSDKIKFIRMDEVLNYI